MAERVGRLRFEPGDPLRAPGGGRRPRCPGSGGRPPVLLPSAELLEQVDDPDPVLALDLVIGLGTAQRQTGDPLFRDTLLEAAHRASEFGDTERLVAAALANNRGFYSAIGATDGQKVEVLEAALSDLPARTPERALVLATLCSELAHGSPLDLRQGLAEEAESIANQSGDDATCVRVLNHLYIPLQVPQLLGPALARTADALVRAERLGDPALLYWAAMWRYQTAARSGDIDELDRCLEIQGEMVEQLGQPMFAWGHTFLRGSGPSSLETRTEPRSWRAKRFSSVLTAVNPTQHSSTVRNSWGSADSAAQ